MTLNFYSVFKDDIKNFLAVRETSLSDSAIKHDVCYLTSFDEFLANAGLKEKRISEEVVSGWLKTLKGKTSTKANKIIVIRIFIKYLNSLGIPAYIPVIPKVSDDYMPYIFSDEELARIFKSADNIPITGVTPNPYIKSAFPMILRLLYGCGTRIGETLALRMRDVDLEHGVLTLLHTKNQIHRFVPVSPSLTDILRKYCLAAGIFGNPDAFLFPGGDHKKPMSVRSAQNKFDIILKNLGIKTPGKNKHERGPCQHCLRHVFVFKSFAQAQRNGRNIDECVPFLSIYLGHDSLSETEKYLKFSSELFPDAMELFEDYAGMVFPEVGHEK